MATRRPLVNNAGATAELAAADALPPGSLAFSSMRLFKSATSQPPSFTATTLSAATSVGATTITTAGAVPVGTYASIATGTAETRMVTASSGSGPYTLTLASALTSAHTSGAAVTFAGFPSFTNNTVVLDTVSNPLGAAVASPTANTLQAVVSGLYLIDVSAWLQGGGTALRSILITLNGAANIREFSSQTAGRISGAATTILAANDTIGMVHYAETSGTYLGGSAVKDTGMTLTYLGPGPT